MKSRSTASREQIRRAKLAKYCEEGRDPYTITRFDRTHTSAEVLSNFDALEGKTVRIAGRMMSRRIMGKASFVHMMDGEGQIQAYVRREDVGEDVYADFKTMDIGDILGVEGVVFRTKTGEVSVHATSLTLLSKSSRVLPEKWNGLRDQDMRYRQRYVDTIVNPEVKDTFIKRSQILKALRASSWMRRASSRSIPRCSRPSKSAPIPAPSSPITTRWISRCICASRRSCTSSA